MRLIACQNCHTQYDVTSVIEKQISCRCGESVENRDLEGIDVKVHRCGSCGAQVGPETEQCDFCGSAIVRDQGVLSLICPECFGRNEEEARFCAACGVSFSPEQVQVEGVELPCPCCGGLMPVRAIGGVGINECPGCNGVWAREDKFDLLVDRAVENSRSTDPEKLRRLAPRVKGSNPAQQKVRYRKCPECDAFMQRRNFRKASGVILDRCGQHGTWLDADELEQIAGFILSGGRPDAERFMRELEERDSRPLPAISLPERRGVATGHAVFVETQPERSLAGTFLRVIAELLD
ncbi:MAG: zf-TFIIB domain-containing protein [Deltaproteobacteria bacterium]|nr:zf-TFIIB domain-containing protein [Deltaproteobacteria bacterium]MBW2417144.1 zf-TFIIB domain-containing protein [Deltaproteobacteria bacterium]